MVRTLRVAALALLCLAACCSSHSSGAAATITSNAAAVRVQLDPGSAKVQVPHSFIGLSHEPLTIAKEVLPTPQYRNFIKLLSSFDTGPLIIRWGGNEQDKLLDPLDDDQWIAMRELHAFTGARYMIGLNLKVPVDPHGPAMTAARMRMPCHTCMQQQQQLLACSICSRSNTSGWLWGGTWIHSLSSMHVGHPIDDSCTHNIKHQGRVQLPVGYVVPLCPCCTLSLPVSMHCSAPMQARDPQLAATQVTNAMRFLPPQSILAFNIGNEADAFT